MHTLDTKMFMSFIVGCKMKMNLKLISKISTILDFIIKKLCHKTLKSFFSKKRKRRRRRTNSIVGLTSTLSLEFVLKPNFLTKFLRLKKIV